MNISPAKKPQTQEIVLETSAALFPRDHDKADVDAGKLEPLLIEQGFRRFPVSMGDRWVLPMDKGSLGTYVVVVHFTSEGSLRDVWPGRHREFPVSWFGIVQNPLQRSEVPQDRSVHTEILYQVLGTVFSIGQPRNVHIVPRFHVG